MAAIVLFYHSVGQNRESIFEDSAGELSSQEYKKLMAELKNKNFLIWSLPFTIPTVSNLEIQNFGFRPWLLPKNKRWAKSCKCWRSLQTVRSKPSDLSVSLPANNVPEEHEKLAVLVSTGKSKQALGAQLFHDQVKRLLDNGVDNFYKGYEA